MSHKKKESKWNSSPFFYLHDMKFYRVMLKNFILTLLVFIIPVMLLIFVIFSLVINNSRNSTLTDNKNGLEKMSSEMEINWTSQMTTCLQASFNTYVQSFIMNTDANLNPYKLDITRHIQDYISSTMSSNPLIDQVLFYFDDEKYLITLSSAWGILGDIKYDTYKIIPMEIINTYYRNNIVSAIARTNQGIYFYRNILSFGELKAAIMIRNNYSYTQKWLAGKLTDPRSNLMILDEQYELLVGSSAKTHYNDFLPQVRNMAKKGSTNEISTIDGHKYSISLHESASTKWIYALVNPALEYEKNLNDMRLIMILLALAVFVASLMLSWFVSLSFYRPIQVIHHLLQHPEEGISYEKDYASIDELGLISTLIQQSHFQKLMMTDELKSKKELLKKAQNVALQAQINPHFIFNTLECINWKMLSHFKMENEITAMLSNFSRLMRLVLQNRSDFVTLQTEIEHAQIYLKIREAQSPNTFSVKWNQDDALLGYMMPSLLLQPIVENAFIHGVRKLAGSECGLIAITCADEGDHLSIEVSDNGPGINEQALMAIRAQLAASMMIENEHIGLSNVHQRIQLTFGEEWGLLINSMECHGTQVKIVIPKVNYLSSVGINK